MWNLPQRLPWQPLPEAHRPDFTALRHLEPEGRELVALSGGGWGRGRYSLVGACATSIAIESAEHARLLFDTPPERGLRILALGYELGRKFAHLPQAEAPGNQPLGLSVVLDSALLVDHQESRWTVIGEREGALHLALLGTATDVAHAPVKNSLSLYPTTPDAQHEANIRRAQELIASGEIYQGNVTRRLHVDGIANGVEAHIAMSLQNPVAHGSYVRAQGIELISNSMETLLTFDPETRECASYPIKGTRQRHDSSDPGREAAALKADEKERAEHVMIVDLVRNDLGRICEVGSVKVPDLMVIEAYQGVFHAVSRVRGTLRQDATLGELVASVFPGGSITGAPKRRAIELLDQIEGEPRGFYTGSLGLLAPTGALSMSILIRTLVRDERGWSLGVGGGIVSDSVPSRELEETRTKVRVFEEVLGEAAHGAENGEAGGLSAGGTLRF